MNRREFLSTATKLGIVTAVGPIFAKEFEINDEFSPKDSISSKHEILNVQDRYLEDKYLNVFKSVQEKITLVQTLIGYGNFNIVSFDYANKVLRYSKNGTRFTKDELDFIEHIFYYDPSYHGFYGDRVTPNLTDEINTKEIEKIAYTGHYLYKGKPMETYDQLTKDVGPTLYLTSGVRSVVKQLKLFLDKLDSVDLNLSKASRSIAPPAFTYHAIGDFDVGKMGLGSDNFTEKFSYTDEFTHMMTLKYIDMRYTVDNKDGVRYEPWHVKIV